MGLESQIRFSRSQMGGSYHSAEHLQESTKRAPEVWMKCQTKYPQATSNSVRVLPPPMDRPALRAAFPLPPYAQGDLLLLLLLTTSPSPIHIHSQIAPIRIRTLSFSFSSHCHKGLFTYHGSQFRGFPKPLNSANVIRMHHHDS